MINRINYKLTGVVAFAVLVLALFTGIQFLQPTVANANTNVSTSTVNLIIQKNISGPSSFTATDFSFNVSGNGVNQHLTISNLGTGFYSSPLTLGQGTYTITEDFAPTGYDSAEWTVLWAGECNEVTEFTASFVVNAGNMGDGDQYCSAENQYRPGVLKIEKKFASSTTPVPFSNFTFKVTQGTATKLEAPFESDGNNSVNIGKGAYSVTENPISGYTASYSAGCSGTINNSENKTCTITNTYNPPVYSQGSYGGGYSQSSYSGYSQASYGGYSQSSYGGGAGTGTIVIEKQTLPNGNQTSFTFNPSWSGTDFTLTDGAQSTTTGLTAGTYNVVESLPTNWTQTSVICSDGSPITAISLQANEKVTCVFTNTQDGGGGNVLKYLVYGYVWHDKNESDIWEKGQPNPADNEVDLDGWTVQITNGSVAYSTTTDQTGYYYFYVPVGTWTITEVLQAQWNQTFPNNTSHAVVVGNITLAEEQSLFASLMSYIFPNAFAQAPTTYGPYDFGNVFRGGNNYSQGSYGGGSYSQGSYGGGSYSQGSYGSSGSYSQGSYGGGVGGGSSSGSKKKKNNPVPQVLGDATSAIPQGAPHTGAGGTAPVAPVLPTLLAIMISEATIRTPKNG